MAILNPPRPFLASILKKFPNIRTMHPREALKVLSEKFIPRDLSNGGCRLWVGEDRLIGEYYQSHPITTDDILAFASDRENFLLAEKIAVDMALACGILPHIFWSVQKVETLKGWARGGLFSFMNTNCLGYGADIPNSCYRGNELYELGDLFGAYIYGRTDGIQDGITMFPMSRWQITNQILKSLETSIHQLAETGYFLGPVPLIRTDQWRLNLVCPQIDFPDLSSTPAR